MINSVINNATDLRRRSFLAAALLLPLAACAAPPVAPAPPRSAASTTPAPDAAAPRFADLERRFDARLGVYALHTGTGQELVHRADERFALCSTFKFLAAAAVLDRNPPEHLDKRIRFTQADLVANSPIAQQHLTDGMTIRELCDAATRYSDNTGGNLLLADLGGPTEITAFARSCGDQVTRLDRTEPTLNTAVPGDERDTTSPRALATTLRTLLLGDRLRPDARALLTDWMLRNTTGDTRIRAGLPAGWRVADKTGTGDYATINDVAIVYPPSGAPIVLATLSSRAQADAEYDNALLAGAATIVVESVGTPA